MDRTVKFLLGLIAFSLISLNLQPGALPVGPTCQNDYDGRRRKGSLNFLSPIGEGNRLPRCAPLV